MDPQRIKTIGIVGSRRRASPEDYELVKAELLKHYNPGDVICSGPRVLSDGTVTGPNGADTFAVQLARELKAGTKWFPAEWELYGKSAGFSRNTDIAEASDILIACVASDRVGGTEDTIQKFVQMKGGKDKLFLV